MPLSTSSCRGRCDANVATERDQGAGRARGPPARCAGRDILNSCELAEGGPFVLAFVFEPVARCARSDPGARARRGPPPRRQVPGRRRPRRRRGSARAGLQPAGRLRPRRRGRQRVRGRGLPDDHVRRPRRPRRRLDRRPASPKRRSNRGCGGSDEPSRRSTPATVDAAVAAELPGLGPEPGARSASTGDVLRRSPPELRERLRAVVGPPPRGDRDRVAEPRDPARLPRAVPASRARAGRGADPGRGADAGAAQARRLRLARAAGGRAARSRPWRPRWACGRSTRTASRGRRGWRSTGGRIVVRRGRSPGCSRRRPPSPRQTRRLVLYAIAAPGVPLDRGRGGAVVAWDIVDSA